MIFQLLFLILCCGYALTAETNDTKQSKRGIPEAGGWVGIPSSHGYGHGQPWLGDPGWKGLKFPPFNLAHGGLHGGLSYGRVPAISLPIGGADLLKTFPVYITKHVVLERPVPVPQPVYIEKPYHVPVPIEKIIHKPVPVPIPIHEAVPVPVERPIAIPVKHPVAVPVQQPYPVPVKQAFPIPVPVPVPIPVHPAPIPLIGAGPVGSPAYDGRGYGGGHFYPVLHGHGLHSHPLPAQFVHGFGAGFGHAFGHEYGHGHGYDYPHAYAADFGHGHEHKKRSKN